MEVLLRQPSLFLKEQHISVNNFVRLDWLLLLKTKIAWQQRSRAQAKCSIDSKNIPDKNTIKFVSKPIKVWASYFGRQVVSVVKGRSADEIAGKCD